MPSHVLKLLRGGEDMKDDIKHGPPVDLQNGYRYFVKIIIIVRRGKL